MRKILSIFIALAALLGIGAAHAGQTLYGADGAGGNPATNLYILDPTTGAVLSTVGPIGFAVTGLAFDPRNGVLYGSTGGTAPISPNSIITIDIATGAGTLVGPTGLGGPVADITFRADGTLFGWSEGSDELVRINTTTGVGSVVGPNALSTAGSGIAFSPQGELFFTGDDDNGDMNTINPATGAVVKTIPLVGGVGTRVNALAFGPGNLLIGSGQNNTLMRINILTGQVTLIGATVAAIVAIAFGPAGLPKAVPTLSEWLLVSLAIRNTA